MVSCIMDSEMRNDSDLGSSSTDLLLDKEEQSITVCKCRKKKSWNLVYPILNVVLFLVSVLLLMKSIRLRNGKFHPNSRTRWFFVFNHLQNTNLILSYRCKREQSSRNCQTSL